MIVFKRGFGEEMPVFCLGVEIAHSFVDFVFKLLDDSSFYMKVI